MPSPFEMQADRAVPVALADAFEGTLVTPLTELFDRRFLALPAIKEVRDAPGEWGTVGQTRRILTADGGSFTERLTRIEPPRAFGYELGEIKGPMTLLADRVEGEWSFAPVGTGTRITWTWSVHPANAVAAVARPGFVAMWRGYARRGLERLEQRLLDEG